MLTRRTRSAEGEWHRRHPSPITLIAHLAPSAGLAGVPRHAQLLFVFGWASSSRLVFFRVGLGVAAPRVLSCGATAGCGEGCPDLADGTAPEGRWLQADGGGGSVGSVAAVAGHRWAPAAAHIGGIVCRAAEVDLGFGMVDAASVAALVAQVPLAAPELGGGPALTDVQGREGRIRPSPPQAVNRRWGR